MRGVRQQRRSGEAFERNAISEGAFERAAVDVHYQ